MNIVRTLMVLGLTTLGSIGWGKEVLLVFTAEWCKPCQKFKQDLMENSHLLSAYEISTIDVDRIPDMADDFAVKTVPTFIVVKVAEDDVIKKTNVVKKEVGYTTLERFLRWLKRPDR